MPRRSLVVFCFGFSNRTPFLFLRLNSLSTDAPGACACHGRSLLLLHETLLCFVITCLLAFVPSHSLLSVLPGRSFDFANNEAASRRRVWLLCALPFFAGLTLSRLASREVGRRRREGGKTKCIWVVLGKCAAPLTERWMASGITL